MNTTETVERVVAPVLSDLGIELVDVESHPGHLKVTIDREAGLDLAAISRATAAVSHALDEADAVPGGRYELEVTSPGVERRLRRPEHFAKFVGSEIAVRLRPGVADDGERRFEGQLAAADEKGIVLALAATGGERRLRYSDLERAHTVFDWRAALASAPSPERPNRREARPSAAERSRAAAEARRAASVAAAPATGAAGQPARRPSNATANRAQRQLQTTDDDRHVTETP
ncbi:MAG: ribosome maturation factor RimP [Acidimicrobiales bacterium]|jgi:ribosome maturation factor RimP